MPDNNTNEWRDDCRDQAEEAGLKLGPPAAGLGADALVVGEGALETPVDPAALIRNGVLLDGAYQLGEHSPVAPVAGLAIEGAADAGCIVNHYAGEGAQFLNDEAHQGAQGVADYLDSHFIDPPSQDPHPAPQADPDASSPSLLDGISAGFQSLQEEIQHAGHAVLEQFEPSDGQPIHEEIPQGVSPDQAASPTENNAESHSADGGFFPSLVDGAQNVAESAGHAEQSFADFWNAPVGTLPDTQSTFSQAESGTVDNSRDSHDSLAASLFGSSDQQGLDSSSAGSGDTHSSFFSLFTGPDSPSEESHNSSFSLFGGSSDSAVSDSSSSMFDNSSSCSHPSDSSSWGSIDHDSASSSASFSSSDS